MIPLQRRIATSKKAAAVRKRVKEARQAPERALHIAVAEYLTLALKPPHWFTTFPAGGGGKVRGAQLKAMGLKAGVPDILIIDGTRQVPIWIELKATRGYLSDEQKATHAELAAAGVLVATCRSIEDVEHVLANCLIETRARAAA